MDFDFEFQPGPFHRTMGPADSRELIGAGFMRKRPGRDHTDYDPPLYSLCYVINGNGIYTSGSKTYELSPGCYFQRIPGQTHSTAIKKGQQWIECFIDLGKELCNTLCQMGMIDPVNPCGRSAIDRSIPELIADIRRTLETCSDLRLKLLLPQILEIHQRIITINPQQQNSENHAIITRAANLLSRNLEQRIDLRQLCDQNSWGYEKFRKLFKDSLGISPARYRLRRRIDEAKRLLLANRDMPLSQIAANLGYSNVYEFSAQFRKLTGLPPGKFRNQ
jgi:AraC-like DNA-binding protein